MTASAPRPQGVIRRDAVRLVSQPAVVDCPGGGPDEGALTVVPLMDGDRVAGLEIRCGCGRSTLVECVYREPAPSQAIPQAPSQDRRQDSSR